MHNFTLIYLSDYQLNLTHIHTMISSIINCQMSLTAMGDILITIPIMANSLLDKQKTWTIFSKINRKTIIWEITSTNLAFTNNLMDILVILEILLETISMMEEKKRHLLSKFFQNYQVLILMIMISLITTWLRSLKTKRLKKMNILPTDDGCH